MPRTSFRVVAECYAGYRGEETPRRFRLGERWIEVAEVLDRWLDPEHRYFKLRGADGDTFILRHDPESGFWEMTLYQGEKSGTATDFPIPRK